MNITLLYIRNDGVTMRICFVPLINFDETVSDCMGKNTFFEERNNYDMRKRALSEEMMRDFLSGKLSPLLRAVQNDDTLCMGK